MLGVGWGGREKGCLKRISNGLCITCTRKYSLAFFQSSFLICMDLRHPCLLSGSFFPIWAFVYLSELIFCFFSTHWKISVLFSKFPKATENVLE